MPIHMSSAYNNDHSSKTCAIYWPMTRVEKPTASKRKSTVVSSQTYRKMVEEALESSPACALDLHGIYESLAERYEQYREDSVEVDWRNSIRHCLSINDNFIRVLPDAIRLTFYPTEPDHSIFYRKINDEITVNRSFWTTAQIIQRLHWQPFIMGTNSNIRKAIAVKVIASSDEILPPLPTPNKHHYNNLQQQQQQRYLPAKNSFEIRPFPTDPQKIPIAKRPSITDMLVTEWIDPTSFLEISSSTPDSFDCSGSNECGASPLATVSGNQAALFNMAVIEEDERLVRMRHRLRTLQQTMPNVLGPLKIDFINVKLEKEPAHLPSPLKEVNGNSSPQLISLPPIFNHPI